MDIRSSLDGLRSIFGATPTTPNVSQAKGSASTNSTSLGSDRATLSSAASEVSLAAGDSDVRLDKVASIQAQLAAGTYNVPASAVAGKLIESMLA
jgi:negative regulator of flagellin synthesis FlgM